MLQKKDYPILEFDDTKAAIVEPYDRSKQVDASPCCVITFFREVVEALSQAGKLREITCLNFETAAIPLYETEYEGRRICLIQGFVGAAGCAALLEEVIACGCGKFIVCGGAGVLKSDTPVGQLFLPYAAMRDEGASYHYSPPSREIACDPYALSVIERELTERHIAYTKAKTWTTDAFFRETRDKTALRLSEGCATVEMEAAALFAVAQFRGVTLGQILYGADDLSGPDYDDRDWKDRYEVRKGLVELSMGICLQL